MNCIADIQIGQDSGCILLHPDLEVDESAE